MSANTPTKRRGPGRPTKLTAEVQDKIVAAVRAGNYLETACVYAGVSYKTVWRWMADADLPGAHWSKIRFRDAVNLARAESEVRVIGHIQRVIMGGQVVREVTRTLPDGTVEVDRQYAPADGRVGLEFASRAYPERWARRSALEVTGAGGGPVQVEHTQLITTLAERLHAQLSDRELAAAEIVDGEVFEGESADQ
jgi:hypothetical protein